MIDTQIGKTTNTTGGFFFITPQEQLAYIMDKQFHTMQSNTDRV